MKLAKFTYHDHRQRVGIISDQYIQPLALPREHFRSLQDILNSDDPVQTATSLIDGQSTAIALDEIELVAPIDRQEVWAAGVTYKRSQTARMEESAAAASCYDRVYASARPELFYKASPHRVRGHGQALRIRRDAQWNVPEPEITLVLNSRLTWVGVTIGNDMSSRDIEGDNPLYLPQAKVYNECCGLGPWIVVGDEMPDRAEMSVALQIVRKGRSVFEGETNAEQMARSFEELIDWLGRDNSFPDGVFLLTGTGIVPDSDFTLSPNDMVRISITGIGTLVNFIVQG